MVTPLIFVKFLNRTDVKVTHPKTAQSVILASGIQRESPLNPLPSPELHDPSGAWPVSVLFS
jgi:hypothetical protein